MAAGADASPHPAGTTEPVARGQPQVRELSAFTSFPCIVPDRQCMTQN